MQLKSLVTEFITVHLILKIWQFDSAILNRTSTMTCCCKKNMQKYVNYSSYQAQKLMIYINVHIHYANLAHIFEDVQGMR